MISRARVTPAWPIAPSYEQPIRTRYSFRPLRRGRYRWNRVNLIAADGSLQGFDIDIGNALPNDRSVAQIDGIE